MLLLRRHLSTAEFEEMLRQLAKSGCGDETPEQLAFTPPSKKSRLYDRTQVEIAGAPAKALRATTMRV